MGRYHSVAIAVVCATLQACTYSPDLTDRAVDYNEAVADTTNKILLLNTLRARERLPTYYTRITSDAASTTFSPNMSLSLPIGPGAVKKGFAPTFGISATAQSQLQLQNLDDQQFMRGVLTPISVDVLSFYLRQGWPVEVLLMLTVSRISVTMPAANALMNAFNAQCQSDPDSDYCNNSLPSGLQAPAGRQYVSDQLKLCLANPKNYTKEGSGKLILQNYPNNIAQTDCFQWAMRVLIALGPMPRTAETLDVIARDVPVGNNPSISSISDLDKANMVMSPIENGKFTICKRSKISGLALLHFQGEVADDSTPDAGADPSAAANNNVSLVLNSEAPQKAVCGAVSGGKSQPQVELTTRSLDGMVYYLGEILREEEGDTPTPAANQSPAPESGTVWAWDGGQNRMAPWGLFLAKSGTATSGSQVSVDFEGSNYYIPSSCDDSQICPDVEHHHRSLQVLALLNQIWGLQKQSVELPNTPTITVIPP